MEATATLEPVGTHARRLFALALPVTLAQVGAMLLTVVDVLMLGRVSVAALDAAALGRVWALGTVVMAMGLVFGIDPVATQAWGARDRARYESALGSGAVVALLSTPPVILLWLLTAPALRACGQSPELAHDAGRFVLAQVPGVPFMLLFFVFKGYLQAQGSVLPAMWVTFAGNALNVLLNWVLIFGHWGAPALGVVGSGLATSATNVFLAVALFLWMRRQGEPRSWRAAWHAGRGRGPLRGVLHHGWAVALQISLEMWTFQIAALLAGRLGPIALAAHTAAISLASLTFTLPLGVSMAAVVRVGNLIGAGKPREARRAGWVALATGVGIMGVTALGFYLGRFQLPRLFTADPRVVLAAAAIMPVAAAFQVFDGTQVVGIGVLRGDGQTRPAAVFNLLGYYVLALPLACWLGFGLRMGLPGIWWGLALGLAVVALLLVAWIRWNGPGSIPPLSPRPPAPRGAGGATSRAAR